MKLINIKLLTLFAFICLAVIANGQGISSNIFGKYTILSMGTTKLNRDYEIEIGIGVIKIKGCNTLSASFSYNPNTQGCILGNWAGTQKACPNDQDSVVSKSLSNTKRVYREGGSQTIFQNFQGSQIVRLVYKQFPGSPIIPQQDNVLIVLDQTPSIYGQYIINWIISGKLDQNINVQITQKTIQFKGCNTNTASFEYNSNTRFYQLGPWASTRIFCQNDKDSFVIEAFKTGYRVFQKKGLIIFENFQGKEVLKLGSKVATPVNQVNPSIIISPTKPQVIKPNWPYSVPESEFPQLRLPGVSCNSIQGTYFFKPANSDLSTIVITFDQSYLQFEGCNIQRIPYAVFTDGLFVLLQGGSSTERQCLIDNDAAYITLLQSVRKYTKTDSGYGFYNRGNQLVANLQNKARNKVVTYGVINGGYQLQTQGIDVYVSQNSIGFFAGCNSVSIPYQLDQFNNIIFGNVITTLRFCEQDNDAAYINAITEGSKLKKIDGGFTLLNQNGIQTVRFVAYQRQYETDYNYFGGNYKLQVPNGGIRLKVSDGVFTLQGCNTFTFKFTLSDNGNIVFGSVSSSNTTCNNNYDIIFLDIILKAQSIAVVDKNLIFFNGNNEQILRAINFDISSNPKKQVILDNNSSPILPTIQFSLPDGTYKFSLLRTSLKVLTLTINKNEVTFKGCNTVNFIYSAASDGTIKFTYKSSTKRGCPDDYDNLYIKALESVVKYSAMKGMYTFYNQKGVSVASFVSDFGTSSGTNIQVISNPSNTLPRKPKAVFKPAPELFVSLKGKFKFQLPNQNFQVVNTAFVYKGCNTYRFPCAFKNSNIYFGQPISTNNECGSRDNLLINLIPRIFNFKKNGLKYTFFDQQSKQILEANTVSSQQYLDNGGVLSGSYEAQIPNTNVEFDDNNFSFSSCSQNKYSYKAKNTGDISFQGNNQPCQAQYYDAYSNAVQNSVKYRKIDNGYVFEDKNGNEKGRCIKV